MHAPRNDAVAHAGAHSKPALIVGVGASAGGISALKMFFRSVPANSPMAFVVIQHLQPSHESHMPEILARETTMPVQMASEAVTVEAGHVYTIPPNKCLSIRQGVLLLADASPDGGLRMPIDYFFGALAEDRKQQSAGVVLSGTGSDGTLGLRAIRAAGGLTLAQAPEEAEFPAMPQHAIDTGMVDCVLPVSQMPERLLAYLQHPYVGEDNETDLFTQDAPTLEAILVLLYSRAGNDFRSYKRATIGRRIERRMGINQVRSLNEYLELLRRQDAEVELLAKDMLIGVTRFFRDPEAFEELRRLVLAPLVQEKAEGSALRVWVPGCATGEEAYTVAMLLLEEIWAAKKRFSVQVFASDIDKDALVVARGGLYPAGIADDLTPERLHRFFARHDGGYAIHKTLRETLVFAAHNLLSDTPFSRMDLVTCRNVLIYLQPQAQHRAVSAFAFALRPGGCLFVGSADTIPAQEPTFVEHSRKGRIYRRTSAPTGTLSFVPAHTGRSALPPTPAPAPEMPPRLAEMAQVALLRHFAASLVLVEPGGQVLHFHGPTAKYLDHRSGKPTLNLFDMAPDWLALKLRAAIESAGQSGQTVTLPALQPESERNAVTVTVLPIASRRTEGRFFAVIFEENLPASTPPHSESPVSREEQSALDQLQSELRATRDDLQTSIARLESANEDLTAANEEVMSMNEELQSTNEELETAKEEAQSVNEELSTVNAELQERLGELNDAHNDLANLFTATHIAMVFLDRELRLKRFAPTGMQVLPLIAGDVGRPIAHISHKFENVDLAGDARRVLEGLAPVEREVRTHSGAWYTLRIMPYRTVDDRIEGVVLLFVDVSRLKQVELTLEHARRFSDTIVQTIREPLLVLDSDLRVLQANGSFYRLFEQAPAQVEGQRIYDLGERQWDIPALRQALEEIIPQDRQVHDLVVEADFARLGRRSMLLNACRMSGEAGLPERILLALEDVTERLKAEESLRKLNETLEERVKERTALAERRADQLRTLALKITSAEHHERARLAQTLHDSIQQLMVASTMAIHDARRRSTDADACASLQRAEKLVRDSIRECRTLAGTLSPPILRQAGLARAVEWFARQMQEQFGLTVGVQVQLDREPEDERIKSFLFQGLRELLFNIVKHAKVNRAQVELTTPSHASLRLVVRDAGVGMAPARLEQLQSCGTGLGLVSLRERAVLLGGEMVLDSATGGGTVVTLTVPLAPGEDKLAAAAVSVASIAAPSPQKRIRVLVVDDHRIMREGVRLILRNERDIEVVGEAETGAEAVELAGQLQPDVVTMDVTMPGMDGVEATRRILEAHPQIQVIGLSMHEEAEMDAAMRQAGAVAYMTKGDAPDMLVAAIRACGH